MRPRYGVPTPAAIDPKTAAQAREAVRVFRSMIPTLNAYARNLSGKTDVRVVISATSNGSTNGRDIFYRPPLALGERRHHKKWLCHERGDDKLMLCPACAQHEQVLVPIYHEIAHIWFDSFGKVDDKTRKEAIQASLDSPYADNAFGRGIRKRCEPASTRTLDYMELSGLISPWMQLLLNSLEDARIENALFQALPGTKVMFEADITRSFGAGVESVDPITGEHRVVHWRDRELNHQVIVALYFKAVGYDYSGWFNDWVVKTLDDAELEALIAVLRKATRVDGVFVSTFPILALLHEKWGYFKSDDDPEPDESDVDEDPEPDASSKEDPSSDVSSESDPGSDVSESDASDPTDGAEGETGDEEGGDSEDQSNGDSSGSGGDKAGSDASGDPDSAGDSEGDDSPSDEEGEVTDADSEGSTGSDGGDPPGSGSSGRPEDLSDADDGPLGSDDSAGDPEAGPEGAGESDGDVPEDVPDGAEAGHGSPDQGDGDSDSDRNGEDSGRGLDGLSDEVPGERGDSEPGGDADDLVGDDGSDADGGGLAEAGDLIDTGPREGGPSGRTEASGRPDIDWGTAELVEALIAEATGHEAPDQEDYSPHGFEDDDSDTEAIKVVIIQGQWFDTPAVGVTGVEILKEGDHKFKGGGEKHDARTRRRIGADGDFAPPENLISKTLLEARVAFAANERGTYERGLRRGRVHSSALGRKAPFGDPKLFEKKNLPGRKSYFVGLGLDISGSTVGVNIDLIKRVAFAEAELLNRLGIPFFMYAHTGDESRYGNDDWKVQLHEIRSPDEPWNDKTRERLAGLSPWSANLDGHTLEQYRKMLDQRRETVKILHYYTDGAMPCENFDEELDVLTREIRTCKQKGYELVGVGVRTDAPKAHGLETVEVNRVEDVALVVADLKKRLLRR